MDAPPLPAATMNSDIENLNTAYTNAIKRFSEFIRI